MHKAWHNKEGMPNVFSRKVVHQISRSHGLKSWWFESNLGKITRPVAAIKSLRFVLFSLGKVQCKLHWSLPTSKLVGTFQPTSLQHLIESTVQLVEWRSVWLNSFIMFLAATRRLWIVSQSVCLTVRLSVGQSVTPFSLCFHHRIIMKLSGVNTIDRSDVQANGQAQRSMVKVTEVKTQFSHFLTITPVWIYIWRWNDAQSVMRIGVLLFFKVIHPISRSHGTKNHQFWLELGVSRL